MRIGNPAIKTKSQCWSPVRTPCRGIGPSAVQAAQSTFTHHLTPPPRHTLTQGTRRAALHCPCTSLSENRAQTRRIERREKNNEYLIFSIMEGDTPHSQAPTCVSGMGEQIPQTCLDPRGQSHTPAGCTSMGGCIAPAHLHEVTSAHQSTHQKASRLGLSGMCAPGFGLCCTPKKGSRKCTLVCRSLLSLLSLFCATEAMPSKPRRTFQFFWFTAGWLLYRASGSQCPQHAKTNIQAHECSREFRASEGVSPDPIWRSVVARIEDFSQTCIPNSVFVEPFGMKILHHISCCPTVRESHPWTLDPSHGTRSRKP